MNQFTEIWKLLWSTLWFKVTLLLIGLFIIILSVSLISSSTPPKLSAIKTNLRDEHIGVIDGNIVAYNGLSFYTIDPLNNEEPKIIHTPDSRLPVPSKIFWSNDGVLLNFESGINYSPVEKYMEENNLLFSQKNFMTWYLNFKDGSLSLVDSADVKKDFAVFSTNSKGFYYITGDREFSEYDKKDQLKFYGTTNKTTKIVIDSLDFVPLSISSCEVNKASVCIAGYNYRNDELKNALFAVDTNGNISEEINDNAKIIPTYDKDQYLLLRDQEDYQDIDTLYKSAKVVDISTGETREFKGDVLDGNIALGSVGESIYLLDGANDEFAWFKEGRLGNTISWQKMPLDENSPLKSGYSVNSNLTDKDFVIAKIIGGNIHIISGKESSQQFKIADKDDVKRSIESCLNSSNIEHRVSLDGFLFSVLVDYNKMEEGLPTVKKCIAKDLNNISGYTYEFRGIDTLNDRLVTD